MAVFNVQVAEVPEIVVGSDFLYQRTSAQTRKKYPPEKRTEFVVSETQEDSVYEIWTPAGVTFAVRGQFRFLLFSTN